MPLWYLEERLGNILALFVTKIMEVTQYTLTVANIGLINSTDESYRCRTCIGEIGVHDGPQLEHALAYGAALEVGDKFCYLGNIINTGDGAEESVIARIRSRWKLEKV